MNVLFFLIGISATFGLIAVVIGVKDQKETARRKRKNYACPVHLRCAACSILGLAILSTDAVAQQVVHAMGGTVVAVDANSLTLTMLSDQGFNTIFHALPKAKADGMLDKQLSALSSPAEQLAKVGDHVVIFYVGDRATLSALAIENLGAKATAQHDGIVSSFDRHSHVVTLGHGSVPETLILSEKTIVDTPEGVTTGLKYKPSKGSHIQVKSAENAHDALLLSVAT